MQETTLHENQLLSGKKTCVKIHFTKTDLWEQKIGDNENHSQST